VCGDPTLSPTRSPPDSLPAYTAFLLRHIGQIAEAEGLQRRFMASTGKDRELSLPRLAIANGLTFHYRLNARQLRAA
jgi:hypothetical protein